MFRHPGVVDLDAQITEFDGTMRTARRDGRTVSSGATPLDFSVERADANRNSWRRSKRYSCMAARIDGKSSILTAILGGLDRLSDVWWSRRGRSRRTDHRVPRYDEDRSTGSSYFFSTRHGRSRRWVNAISDLGTNRRQVAAVATSFFPQPRSQPTPARRDRRAATLAATVVNADHP